MIDRKVLLTAAASKWGTPYLFGSKWNSNTVGPIDCSGFTRWVYAQIGINIPDGSSNQYLDSCPESFVLPGDLCFLKTPLGPQDTHHVGMVYDNFFVIESRGIIQDGKEIGSVMLRPRIEWEARSDFDGYRRPKSVIAIEGA